MTAQGLFETQKPHDCEEHIARSIKGEMQKLWDRTVVHIKQAMEVRRYPDEDHESDFGERLRRLEGQLEEQEPRIAINNHPRSPKSESWQNKVLVGVAITVLSAAIISAVATYTAVATLTTQLQMYIQANNQRLDADESRIHDTERRLDRGAP